jgi:hypothetical protein
MTTIEDSPSQAEIRPRDGSEPVALAWAHAGRLRAAERELTTLLAQVGGLGRDGRNPSGQGPNYAPLAGNVWDPLSDLLDEIASSARKVGRMAGPVGAVSAVHGPSATRSAILQRLTQMEDMLKELDPDRLEAKFGALPTSVANDLREQCGWMRDLLAQAHDLIEASK